MNSATGTRRHGIVHHANARQLALQISETPGADRTNSLQMITDYVPGAYMVHDQLHVRGGHQVSWLIDGVPVPNTSIASNVGPQFDPKDIDYLEIQRGGYSADYGDRTYGIFNVVPRTGFDFNNDAEIVATYGNYNQTNSQVNFGGHTQRFAYYASVNANRSDDGLETPERADSSRSGRRRRRLRFADVQRDAERPASPRRLHPPRFLPGPEHARAAGRLPA